MAVSEIIDSHALESIARPRKDAQGAGDASTVCSLQEVDSKRTNPTDIKAFWVRCDQCEQWRKTKRQYGETESFLCSALYGWVFVEGGAWKGGCNASPDAFRAFDRAVLKQELTMDVVRDSVENLLHKLPKDALTLAVKWSIIEELKSDVTCDDLMDKVHLYARQPVDASLETSFF